SGPNGFHRCLVTDAAKISIHEAKDAAYHRLLHLPAARAIASQLILGLQFIHSQGIVHGGKFGIELHTYLFTRKLSSENLIIDLHLGNILLRLPPEMRRMTREQLYAKVGEPEKERVVRCDGEPLDQGVPSEAIVPVWLGLGSN